MELEMRLLHEPNKPPTRQVNTPIGWLSIGEISEKTEISISTLGTRLRTAKTYGEFVKPTRRLEKDDSEPLYNFEDELEETKVIHAIRKHAEAGKHEFLLGYFTEPHYFNMMGYWETKRIGDKLLIGEYIGKCPVFIDKREAEAKGWKIR